MPGSHGSTRGAFALLALTAVLIAPGLDPSPARAQGISIGLYTEPSGSTCSFSGDATGLLTAYVVVKPDAGGVRGVRFAAPIPDCFKATYVGETVGDGLVSIGNSQDGISISSGVCETAPLEVLEITYMRAGGTSPCCEYPLTPEPIVTTMLEAVDCAFNTVEAAHAPSHFNADESCPCSGATAPLAPFNPLPPDAATAQSIYTALHWSAADFDNDLLNYDVYLGHDANPPLVMSELAWTVFQPMSPLDPVSTYYWRIVARDAAGHQTSGPIWSFTTRLTNSPPTAPQSPFPGDLETMVLPSAILHWTATDIDGDSLVYDVSFGTSSPPPQVAAGVAVPLYDPPALEYETTYYWQVVARDAPTGGTAGPVWSFTTRPANLPPEPPSSPSPANTSIGQPIIPTLSWQCSDPDQNALTYDVYFGTAPTPPLVASDVSTKSYAADTLSYSTTYYWKIVAEDIHGAQASSPVWTFTTRPENYPPSAPHTPTPPDGATNVSLTVQLIWGANDPDGDALKFDLYLGTDPSPPLVLSNHSGYAYKPPQPLQQLVTYYWRVVARDSHGAEAEGPTWSFATAVNQPPVFSPYFSPGNNAVNVSVLPELSWQATDPEGQPREYDIYLGTDPDPPLFKEKQQGWSYRLWQPLEFFTRYYWRIVARDEAGAETSSITLTFTTGGNHPPQVTWDSARPKDKGYASLNPNLWWISYDPDGQALVDSLFFGTAEPLPLIASGIQDHQYSPGLLHAGSTYYWRVVTSDGEYSAKGKTWSFTALPPGDVNNDGMITLDDAACALLNFTQYLQFMDGACGGEGSNPRGDVNCDQMLTPRDARCIHKNVLDGSCSFCEGAPAVITTTQRLTPVVTKDSAWIEWDTLIVRLSVSNVPSLQSFGFRSLHFPEMRLARVARYGVSASSSVLAAGELPNVTTHHNAEVGGYWLDEADATDQVGFIELRYYLPDRQLESITLLQFLDDLEGAPEVVIEGTEVPVLFSAFSATPVAGGVNVQWQLISDEAMDSYSLYRSEGASPPREIARGKVESTRGSYLDTGAQAGRMYRYELAIATTDGDVFRSPAATATIPSLQLALHQNHPNPFNPITTIRYDLPGSSTTRVRLWIVDLQGRIVRRLVDEDQPGGSHEVVWNGTNDDGGTVSSGVYFYVLDVDRERRTRKLVLLK